MKKVFGWMREEMRRIIPIFLFFFVIFSLADITRILRSRELTETYYNFMAIFISALMMAKVILISDWLPVIARYSQKPLAYNIVWKTLIYWISSFFFRLLDRGLPAFVEHKSFSYAFQSLGTELAEINFWIAQIWLGVLLLILVAFRELVIAVGPEKVGVLFFGPKNSGH